MLTKDFKVDFDVHLKKWEFEGYAAIKNNVDLVGERIRDGAFTKTLRERFPKRKIKVFWRHVDPMGLPKHMEEDSTGLFTVSKVSETRTNEEYLVLLRDKVVDEMSIGYDIIKDNIVTEEGKEVRDLLELKLYEYSPVPFGANELTQITAVKNLDIRDVVNLLNTIDIRFNTKKATSFSDLPLADRSRSWDATAAEGRVRKWAGGPDKDDINWTKYRKAFFWYDADDRENFKAYKLPFADVIGGTLTAVPKGIFASAAAVQGARGGVDIPSSDESGVKSHIEKYYAKMRREFGDESIIAPWNKSLSKEGRILSASNRQKIVEAVRVLQELLEIADAVDRENGKGLEAEFNDMLNELRTYISTKR